MTMFHRVRPLGGLVDKTFEDVIVERDILVEALLTCANLAQNEAVNAEVERVLTRIGLTIGGAP